jgi:hypothetical protein
MTPTRPCAPPSRHGADLYPHLRQDTGVGLGVVVSPRFPMASYQGTASAVPKPAEEITALAAAASGAKARFMLAVRRHG